MKFKNLLLLFLILLFTSCIEINVNNGITGYNHWEFFKNNFKIGPASCIENFFLTSKEILDYEANKHWNDWKISGNDTTECILDFSEIMPFEWDTLVYFYRYKLKDSNELCDYSKKYSISSGLEGLHFLKNGNIVYYVNLDMSSDNEKGICFCTHKDIIKRSRNNAKFHILKKGAFYVVLDMTEEHAPIWRFNYR